MERPKSPYSIHSRPTTKRNRRIYHAVFRDETGKYQTAVSTGCTRRDDAVRWCEACLEEAGREAESVRSGESSLTFAEYARGFWSPTGAYAAARDARGYTVTRGYLDACESITRVLFCWNEFSREKPCWRRLLDQTYHRGRHWRHTKSTGHLLPFSFSPRVGTKGVYSHPLLSQHITRSKTSCISAQIMTTCELTSGISKLIISDELFAPDEREQAKDISLDPTTVETVG